MTVKSKKIEIAQIFREMANFLALKGENPFRIRAYEKTADALEHLSGNLKEIYDQGKLKQISGIGKGMLERIEIILNTGDLPAYQQLKSSFPPGLIEILSIPDMGPKTAKLLYEKIGIKDVQELEEAALKGKLQTLFGMGAKKENNILRGIRIYRASSSRIILGEALPLAESVIWQLKKQTPSLIKKIFLAGSLRRGKETVRDIDILTSSSDPSSLMQLFTSLSFVEEILAKGKTKSSILTHQGLQIDLRVVPDDCFGAALQYFTGSKSHNIKLRQKALKKGLKINEYGVFINDKTKIAGDKEDEVYKILNLPFIPPELREDRGEIEAAEKNLLPNLLKEEDIKGDLHLHSKESDGRDEIVEMAIRAQKKGYQYIAITDHSPSLKIAGGLDGKTLLSQALKIKKLNSKLPEIKIFSGVEVNIKADGSLDLSDDVLSKLDVVVAAIHSGFKQDKKTITCRVIKAMRHPLVSILAHPSGRLLGKREAYAIDLDEILDVAAEEKVWLEINSQPERLDLTDYWAIEAKKRGVKIVINTDAHSTKSLDFIKMGVITARRGWLEKEDVINTLPLKEFLEALKRRKRK